MLYLTRVTKDIFPQQDTGQTMGGMQGTQDASFTRRDRALKQSVAIVRADSAVQNVVGFTVGQGTSNSGFMFIVLKPLQQRGISATGVVNRLRPKLMGVGRPTIAGEASSSAHARTFATAGATASDRGGWNAADRPSEKAVQAKP